MFFNGICDLYDQYDCFFIDMFGVLFDGNDFYEGALNLLKEMKSANKKIIILSNATVSSKESELSFLKKGLIKEIHFDEYITSGDAFKYEIETGSKIISSKIGFTPSSYTQIYVKNTSIFDSEINLEYVDKIKFADFVYVGVPKFHGNDIPVDTLSDFHANPIRMQDIFDVDWKNIESLSNLTNILEECLKYNKLLVAINPDLFAQTAIEDCGVKRKAPVLRQGGIAEYYEKMGGNVLYFGKPYGSIYDYAKRFAPKVCKSVMIGDTPWTDVLGGNMASMDTILTLTGISGEFIKNMPKNSDISSCIKELFNNVAKKLTHKNLRQFSVIPTHIVKSFSGV